EEGSPVGGEELSHLRRALLEGVVGGLDLHEEARELLQRLDAGQPRQALEDGLSAHLKEAQSEAAGHQRGGEEAAQRFVAEEVENAAGRVQEIEGVLRGGRVEDEHLPTPAGVERSEEH